MFTSRIVRRLRCALADRLTRAANVLDPGVEHEHYVCPECDARWRARP